MVPSAGVWSRLARHLPFVETITKMPWFYSARNVTIVALLVSLFSFGGGYFIANFTSSNQSQPFGISNQPEKGDALYEGFASTSNFSNEEKYTRNTYEIAETKHETNSSELADNSIETNNNLIGDDDTKSDGSSTRTPISSSLNTKLAILQNPIKRNKSFDKTSDRELNKGLSSVNSSVWKVIDYRFINELPVAYDRSVKSRNTEVVNAAEDFAIEPKSTQKFLGFNAGISALVFGNANDMKLSKLAISENKDLLSLQPTSLSYRFSGGITLGQYFGIKTGLGIRDFHFAEEDIDVQGVPAPKFASSGQPNDGVENWDYIYREGSVRTLQIPVLAGVHYDFGKLFVEAHIGKVFVKTLSAPTGKTFRVGDQIEGTTLLSTDGPDFSIRSLNEISGGIGYAISNRWSLVLSPTYQFSNSKISFGENQFSPSAFGVSAGLKVSL